jgi:hypothetical protein
MLEELPRRLSRVQVNIVAEAGERDLVIAGNVKTELA